MPSLHQTTLTESQGLSESTAINNFNVSIFSLRSCFVGTGKSAGCVCLHKQHKQNLAEIIKGRGKKSRLCMFLLLNH